MARLVPLAADPHLMCTDVRVCVCSSIGIAYINQRKLAMVVSSSDDEVDDDVVIQSEERLAGQAKTSDGEDSEQLLKRYNESDLRCHTLCGCKALLRPGTRLTMWAFAGMSPMQSAQSC